MKNKILILIMCLVLISLANASSLGTFKQNDCVSLYQICDDCTYVNLTSITYPNSTTQNINQAMTKNGQDYTYSFCNTSTSGNYLYNTCGDKEGTLTCEEINFIITKTGKDLTTHESLLYLLLTLAIFGIFLLSLYFTIKTPYSNNTNEKGMIIQVTKTKYIKLGLILLSYVLFIWLLNILIGVSDNFLTLTLYYGFVSFLFTTLMHLSIPLGIFILVVAFFEIIKDANIQGNINKFGSAFK